MILRRKVEQKFFTSVFFSEKDERIEGAKNAGWRKLPLLIYNCFDQLQTCYGQFFGLFVHKDI
jgi:hypothetical protein